MAFTIIGDLVGSRNASDRVGLQAALLDALAAVNREVPHVQALEPTVGDEFQGAYASLGEAVTSSLLVRLELSPLAEARTGIGHGDLTVLDAGRAPLLQDGPAWWAARDAIQLLALRAKRARSSLLRTWFVAGSRDAAGVAGSRDAGVVSAGPVNSFLICRDQMVGRMKPDARELLRLSLLGATQSEMAGAMGISQSAVSQRLSNGGINALKDAHDLMKGDWS